MNEWSGKKVIIIGAARQGQALARYLVTHGAQVVLNDQRPASQLDAERANLADLEGLQWVVGSHPLQLLDGADLVCPSGGVPLSLPLLQEAARRGIACSNDSQIFLETAPCKVIGITGSAGKTTTTTLVGRMALDWARRHGVRAWVGGNIGNPLISVLDQMQPEDLAVMELSSFQLEIMTRSPQVAAVLNITPNHLDRHETMEAYRAAKAHILAHQQAGDIAVLSSLDQGAWGLRDMVIGDLWTFGNRLESGPGKAYPAVYEHDGSLWLWDGTHTHSIMSRSAVRLRGEHNLLNVQAACAIAAAAGLDIQAMRAGVEDFGGVPHRLQFLRNWHGAAWYNDSIATAPERVMAALRSFEEPLVLLAGGRDKNLPWEEFAALVCQRVDHLVLFGEAASKILQVVEQQRGGSRLSVDCCDNLRQAVMVASRLVQPGDVVLLSPGGTSFDEFKDFEERGVCYTQYVNDLP